MHIIVHCLTGFTCIIIDRIGLYLSFLMSGMVHAIDHISPIHVAIGSHVSSVLARTRITLSLLCQCRAGSCEDLAMAIPHKRNQGNSGQKGKNINNSFLNNRFNIIVTKFSKDSLLLLTYFFDHFITLLRWNVYYHTFSISFYYPGPLSKLNPVVTWVRLGVFKSLVPRFILVRHTY